MQDKELSIISHLDELRTRIIICLASVAVASIFSYGYCRPILEYLIRPVGKLVFLSPQEMFVTYLKIALFAGVILSSPVIFFQLWRFVSVGLKDAEKRHTLLAAFLSLSFFIVGISFGFFIVVPTALKFLLGFGIPQVEPMITVNNYISFVGVITLVSGVIFELPLLMSILTLIGIVNPTMLKSKRRYSILLIFIIAAILTPPDVVTQTLMAIPLVVLYEVGIIFSYLVYKPRDKGYNI